MLARPAISPHRPRVVSRSGRAGVRHHRGTGVAGAGLVAVAARSGQGHGTVGRGGFPGRADGARGAVGERGVAVLGRQDLIAAARAPGTWKRYGSLWKAFSSFCDRQGFVAEGASEDTVIEFLVDLCNSGKGSSVRASLAAIKAAHVDAGLWDPTAPRQVELAAEGASRVASESKNWPRERLAFPVGALLVHVVSLRFSRKLGLRDAALVALGLRLMLRPSELVKLQLKDLRFVGSGVQVRRGKSKADEKAERKPVTIEPGSSSACPVRLLTAQIEARKTAGAVETDRVFVGVSGKDLSSSAVTSIIRDMAAAAGFVGTFSGHSLRIGGASAAMEAGLTADQVKAVGGWKSEAVRQYMVPVLQRQHSVTKILGL